MKKTILILFITFGIALSSNAQYIKLPVQRTTTICSDTATLFDFQPHTLELIVISGASFGNINLHYKIIDSVANAPHYTPFGMPFSRNGDISGDIQLPLSIYTATFNADKTVNVAVANQMLNFMFMKIDISRLDQVIMQ